MAGELSPERGRKSSELPGSLRSQETHEYARARQSALQSVRRTYVRQQPTQRVVQICQRRSLDRIVMIGAVQFDHAFFPAVGVNYQPVKARRDDFIPLGQQEDCRRMNRFRVLNAVEISRDLQRDWTRQQPQVPPPKLTKDHFTQRRWIMQNQSGDGTMCRDI